MARLMDGKALSKTIQDAIAQEVATLTIRPGLAVILVGDDPASAVYVRMKKKACDRVGFLSREYRLPATVPEAELAGVIQRLNGDPEIHGILLQLPLPAHLDASRMLNRIDPDKDVDGFHPVNAGRLLTGQPGFVPCTPRGIMALLDAYQVPLSGRRAVVIGRSNIVGKPVAMLLLQRHATVTVCHSRTADLPAVAREADVLVAAVGRPYMVDGGYIREGAVVIDVGVNRVDDPETAMRLFGKDSPKVAQVRDKGYCLCGDVHAEEAMARASLITPVPGGVGPLTIAMLMQNTLEGAKRSLV